MFEKCSNSKKQGDVGLGRAIAWYTSQGYTVCVPLTDSQDYDLIVDIEGSLKKVQVKTTSFKTGYDIYQASLKVAGGNTREFWIKKFDNSAVDLLFVLTSNGTMYSIPTSDVDTTTSLNLGNRYDKYKIQWVSG